MARDAEGQRPRRPAGIRFHAEGMPGARRREWRRAHALGEAWCFGEGWHLGTGARTLVPAVLLSLLLGLANFVCINEGSNQGNVRLSTAIVLVVWTLAVWSYLQAHRTKPPRNRVPKNWLPPRIEENIALLDEMDPAKPPRDWCPACGVWKPPRTHHCSSCNACCLRMDHHCVWVGNCVGFHNHAPFFLFLVYMALLAALVCVLMAWRIFEHFTGTFPLADTTALALAVVELAASGIPAVLVVPLLRFQTELLLRNATTIEEAQAHRTEVTGSNNTEPKPVECWDLGSASANLAQTFGKGPRWLWWLPLSPQLGDGVKFRKA
jgi:DHHC palmitoyltransferase